VQEAAAKSMTPLAALSLVNELFTSGAAAGRGREGTHALVSVGEQLAK
jgi:3-hydroxyisobutyrate dehydrogenase-like beta-hydroxyacid dehydrogenase